MRWGTQEPQFFFPFGFLSLRERESTWVVEVKENGLITLGFHIILTKVTIAKGGLRNDIFDHLIFGY